MLNENYIEIWDTEKDRFLMSIPECDKSVQKIAVMAYTQGHSEGFKRGTQYGLNQWNDTMDSINKYIKQIKKEKKDGLEKSRFNDTKGIM